MEEAEKYLEKLLCKKCKKYLLKCGSDAKLEIICPRCKAVNRRGGKRKANSYIESPLRP
jgi:phage FluMu protein Com